MHEKFRVRSKFAEDERELNIVLPHASEARPLTTKPDVLFVNIDRQGHYFVDRQLLDVAALEAKLKQVSANNPGRQTVEIRADKECLWQFVVEVMNLWINRLSGDMNLPPEERFTSTNISSDGATRKVPAEPWHVQPAGMLGPVRLVPSVQIPVHSDKL